MAAHILCAPLYMYVTPDRSRYYDAPVSFFYTAFFSVFCRTWLFSDCRQIYDRLNMNH